MFVLIRENTDGVFGMKWGVQHIAGGVFGLGEFGWWFVGVLFGVEKGLQYIRLDNWRPFFKIIWYLFFGNLLEVG